MTIKEWILVAGLMIASVLVFVGAVIWLSAKMRLSPDKYTRIGVSTALLFSVWVMVAIWLLRFAVGFFSLSAAAGDSRQLTVSEEIANSLFGALRSFSMEEEYEEYIMGVKTLLGVLLPGNHWCIRILQLAVVAFASLLHFLAPVLGGAIVLEILASVFPKFKLSCMYASRKRPKYYFSELNAASLALAKSIYYDDKDNKPVLIFTDTYVSDEKEKEYELLLEARKYGAICLRDDLAHVKKTKHGKCAYFLMDENELGNFQTLMELAEPYNLCFMAGATVYLFVQGDAYVQVEKQFNQKLEAKEALLKGGELPTIVPVRAYRNLVHNLFGEVPLYEPLIHKKDKTKLGVTILGNGTIGAEAFLSTYWFGQMLISHNEKEMSECELTVNVVSKDGAEAFWSKLDHINPEIKQTVAILGDNEPVQESKLLFCDARHSNNPYCRVRFVEADVMDGDFWDGASQAAEELLASDYFIVALGSDGDNVTVADKLRCIIGKKHLEEADDTCGNAVIAYSVFDSQLAAALNGRKHYQCRAKGKTDIYMYAFGSLSQVYSCSNVYMSKAELLAKGTGEAYDKARMRQMHIVENRNRKKSENKNYNHWADMARAMHIQYKAFSLGLMQESVFDYKEDDRGAHSNYLKKQCELYKRLALADPQKGIAADIRREYDALQQKQHLLAWLEHRRWLAFTRTMGYRYTGAFERNLALAGNHKNMELKLHPCLVEARKEESAYSQKEIIALFEDLPPFDPETLTVTGMLEKLQEKRESLERRKEVISKTDVTGMDALDVFSYEWCKLVTPHNLQLLDAAVTKLQNEKAVTQKVKDTFSDGWNGVGCCDFKMYDYCTYDFKD